MLKGGGEKRCWRGTKGCGLCRKGAHWLIGRREDRGRLPLAASQLANASGGAGGAGGANMLADSKILACAVACAEDAAADAKGEAEHGPASVYLATIDKNLQANPLLFSSPMRFLPQQPPPPFPLSPLSSLHVAGAFAIVNVFGRGGWVANSYWPDCTTLNVAASMIYGTTFVHWATETLFFC